MWPGWPARPERLTGRGWPKFWGSLRHALAPNEASQRLSRLVFDTGAPLSVLPRAATLPLTLTLTLTLTLPLTLTRRATVTATKGRKGDVQVEVFGAWLKLS